MFYPRRAGKTSKSRSTIRGAGHLLRQRVEGENVSRVSREFQVFVKPAGAACNLDCRYCYYLEKSALYPSARPAVMPDALLERYIVQHIEAAPGTTVTFSWHGGEPTILGLGYFRRIVALQNAHRPAGYGIVNGMQTNGILLDEDWARFLADEEFRVGLSLDGPADVHDRYRVARGGQPTHARVVRAFELLQRFRVPSDVLCVVHEANVRDPGRLYRFFRRLGAGAISFLPLVRPLPGGHGAVTPETVPAEAYGRFLCAVFDEWVARDAGRIEVQIFDEATRPARGLDHSLCIFRKTCGDIPVVEHTGDVYSCDHFVDARHLLGNLAEVPLAGLLESPVQRAFGRAKWDLLPQVCRQCDVLPMCHGGCPKDRFVCTADGEPGLNYLCPAFKQFFTHSLPYAVNVASEDPARASLVEMADRASALAAPPAAGNAVGRNDPCPCGSGRKYKKCCLRA